MYKIKLDGVLLWDPRVSELKIDDPKVKLEVNRAGTLTFRIFPAHPLYSLIKKLKSSIEVYQDDSLIFRGRPIDDELDMFNVKDITCEGDLAVFNDSIIRPYDFQGSVYDYMAYLINNHNSQVETEKEFVLGTVTVTDPNDFIVRANSNYPDTWKEIEEKLIKILGGYIRIRRVDGVNYIDYLDDSVFRSDQIIRLSENLLDVKQSRSGDDIYTAIIPVGAELENEDGSKYRVDIKSVNNDVDYVFNQDAVDLYGWIFKMEKFDDVTEPSNLILRANEALAQSILLLNTIELTALDLSMIDVNIDKFKIFEYVEVISTPHQLDDLYLIRKMDIDLMNPENNQITVGKEFATLSEKQFQTETVIEKVSIDLKDQSETYTNDQVNQISVNLSNTIAQTAAQTISTIGEKHYLKSETDQLVSDVNTELTQTKNSFDFEFNQLTLDINDVKTGADVKFIEIYKYIRFDNGDIILGESGNQITLRIENDRISFLESNAEVAYFANRKLYVTDGEFIHSLRVGNFAFVPRANGNLSFRKVT